VEQLTEVELIQKTLYGETDAFGELVRKYQDIVYATALHRIKDFDIAKDVAQDTFLEAYKNLHTLREPASFHSWLYSITLHQCNRWQRKQRETVSIDDLQKTPSNSYRMLDERLEREELQRIVMEAISALPEETGEMVTMYYIDGLSYGEIANFLSKPVSTVKGRLQMGKKQLKEELITMTEGLLKDNRPGNEFTEKVMNTIKKAKKAQNGYYYQKAVEHCDEAIEMLRNIPESIESKNLKRDALQIKSASLSQHISREKALTYSEEALAIEKEIGDKSKLAYAIAEAARCHSNVGNLDKSMEYYQQSLDIFTEIRNKDGQGRILQSLGSLCLATYKIEESISYYQKALDLFTEMDYRHADTFYCNAALALLGQFGKQIKESSSQEWQTRPTFYGALCDIFCKSTNTIDYLDMSGSLWDKTDDKLTFNASPFRYMPSPIKLIKTKSFIGDNWLMNVPSGGHKPMKISINIRSESENISVPAGEFSNCLWVEMTTKKEPEHCEENRCGKRDFMYAPGVGLVKSIFVRRDGVIGVAQLTSYNISGKTDEYLPFALGNRWVYEWADKEGVFPSTDVYEVASIDQDRHYVSHYYYASKEI